MAESDSSNPNTGGSPYAGLPGWKPEYEKPREAVLYRCHRCHEGHRLARRYWLPTIIFFLVASWWRWENYFYCPRCMRTHILLYLIPNMLVATVLAPFILLIWLWTFFGTFSRRPYDPERDPAG